MWTKEKLLQSQTKKVSVCGDEIIIRKLKSGEVLGKSSSDEEKTFIMVANSIVEPELSIEDIKAMSIEFINAVMAEILAFNGLDKKEPNQGN